MNRTGAELVREALESLGVRFTFGIPGVHNTEIYDQLAASGSVTPVLVAHEAGAAFMADAVSRIGGAGIGTIVVVPAAGLTHAASGIGEAFLDGIPMLVISGGVRRDTGRKFQLHDIDQHAMLRPITKGTWLVRTHDEIRPAIHAAHALATSGEPGPVYVEIPVDLQLFRGAAGADRRPAPVPDPVPAAAEIERAARLIARARSPGIFCGWGAVGAGPELVALAERLGAPVSTTLQGLSSFAADHPLHASFGLGPSATPAGENAFADCDCLIAVGTRFAEIATGSYGARVPEALVHIDINPASIGANYPAAVALVGDARPVLAALNAALGAPQDVARERGRRCAQQIARDKAAYLAEWHGHDSRGRVNPARFFATLRAALPRDGIVVADDGNHTFLTAELMPILEARTYLSPTDFNCMGYCIPATIGAKLAAPSRVVVGIVGDGAIRMTGLEAVTAVARGLGIAWFVFNDGELAQIAQAQQIPLNRKTCSVLAPLDVAGLAAAVGAAHVAIEDDTTLVAGIGTALALAAAGRAVFADVRIDYSKRTRFTEGTVRTTLGTFDVATKARFVGRALWRRITG
jgi:acetolactate synthase-1/2/3 large subunit